jgi:hypothetical protein
VINDVTGLQTALDGKAPTTHTHTKSQITDFAHTHVKADITDFAHTHTTSEITGLDTALAGKAPTVHTHTVSQITDIKTGASVNIHVGTTAPGSPAAGDLWVDTN